MGRDDLLKQAIRNLKEGLIAQRQRCIRCGRPVCQLENPACKVI